MDGWKIKKTTEKAASWNNFRAGANLVYALAILNAPVDYANKVVALITSGMDLQQSSPIHAQQIFLAWLFYDAQGEELIVDEQFLKMGRLEQRKRVIDDVERKSNKLQKEILEVLGTMEMEAEICEKYVTLDGDAYIPIVLRGVGKREGIAVRPLEQSCYTSSPDRQILGSVEAHIELLQAYGWSVVLIPYFEWNQYQRLDSRVGYLKRRLEKAM
eukprot:TRINITY_DN6029_c0_g2_i4.p2 TRINITY_DN6029_c0_g2~~TRINITY_DN6029_c0_g2_i4.p2  ORF type:complete len:215 (-),score=37.20 TRINITY_DN6029_c0_g2_i4:85-729(-)